ncbi:hypothetical protein FOC4_g10012585 [Fusarium odoratissimum]|uniref:WW domain-containing protein n=1 Tax=Fusarium oxysporum f. sp. cubense (strain race 4) TaxID=2502994 RepID=N1RQU1_FUSC4|nr:hypothetical protein FOC4_g10012585 [Fusarium odoratissimum]
MSGLPEGWESDYDGRRWFYKYKPTGHIQYHFPKEGDEFPDFIDTFSPAPVLAPEERLESQQQVRRYASTTTPAKLSPKKEDGGYGMSATARPVSMTWDGGFEDEENGVFQPENFMYLGPGTYNDVSPLAEEEEEAARRVVAGGIEGRVEKSSSKVRGRRLLKGRQSRVRSQENPSWCRLQLLKRFMRCRSSSLLHRMILWALLPRCRQTTQLRPILRNTLHRSRWRITWSWRLLRLQFL